MAVVIPSAPVPAVATAALELVDRTRTGLLLACHASTADDRFQLAHLAALRAGGALLAGAAPGARRSAPRNVWATLPAVAPDLSEWADFFTGTAAIRAEIERGARHVSTREADDLVRQVETFLELVLAHLGLPMMESFTACVAPTGRC
ncbi:SAV_6107 family HEPN domain-containing protein [Rudaeicoccus suwonensis]|uniref:SAV-6107-like HEPN domain-containing protein n=1 Tax=Rudaeicoccus suwonensis TaxID=657409 RepID=A0A561EBL8_9MICO|nr:SAV_6107 family HEPN domain-containing protein [Rudaeicoccus suwonensis]TWE12998.1 hypothetical protein BKA23_1826 [Rudaeicoccus suwonensis]